MASLQPKPSDEKVAQGMHELLAMMNLDDVFGLVRTTTSGLISARTLEEAVQVIVRFSDASTFLNRRAVTREVLLKYLYAKGVSMQLPLDKKRLCSEILNLWGVAKNATTFTNYNGEAAQNTASEEVAKQHETSKSFGTQFCTWFFQRWNNMDGFGAHDFWDDCNLRIDLCAAGSDILMNRIEVQKNGAQCFSELQKLSLVHKVQFQPNLSETEGGIRSQLDPHGLAEVMVCGIITGAQNNPVGVFEQVFGLIKDAGDSGNYKVKFCILKCKQKGEKDNSLPACPQFQAISYS